MLLFSDDMIYPDRHQAFPPSVSGLTIKASQDDKLGWLTSIGWIVREDSVAILKRTGHVLIIDSYIHTPKLIGVMQSQFETILRMTGLSRDGEDNPDNSFKGRAEKPVCRNAALAFGVLPGG